MRKGYSAVAVLLLAVALGAGACTTGRIEGVQQVASPACVPTTCAAQGEDCQTISDGCGGTLDCGACTAPPACVPTTCAAQGRDCQTISDGCGGTLDCGACTAPQTCGGGGVEGACGTPACTPPVITAQPLDATAEVGERAAFVVTATGGGSLAYQWFEDGVPIEGASAAVYETPALRQAQDGASITVAVSDAGCEVLSAAATLTVLCGAACAPPAAAVVVSPSSIALRVGQGHGFTAEVSGATSAAVTWSVEEGASGGTVSGTGQYTAPSTTGTFHVVATSVAAPSAFGVATVTVTSGCVSETNVAFCLRLGVGSGPAAGTDNCGLPRVATCGSAMPLVGVGRPAFGTGTPALLVDGHYANNPWPGIDNRWEVAAPAWAAIDVGAGPSRLLVSPTTSFYGDSVTVDIGFADYTIQTSADSTNGLDGTWTTAVSVTANPYSHAAHLVPFAGMRWLKLRVTSPSSIVVDELDIWDASTTSDESFVFIGDSITASWTWRADAQQPSFQKCVEDRSPGHYPMQIGAGIVGIGTQEFLDYRLDGLLAAFPMARYWGVGLGTNDSATDTPENQGFSAAMLGIITKIRDAGRVPIVARVPYASSAPFGQYTTQYNDVIDALTASQHLPTGPDLYTLIRSDPETYLVDGVHPTARGSVAMSAAWAEALLSLRTTHRPFATAPNGYAPLYHNPHGEAHFGFKDAKPGAAGDLVGVGLASSGPGNTGGTFYVLVSGDNGISWRYLDGPAVSNHAYTDGNISVVQDSVNYDAHLLFTWQNANGRARYGRLLLTRDTAGHVSAWRWAFTSPDHLGHAFRFEQTYSSETGAHIIEVIDVAGHHRLLAGVNEEAFGAAGAALRVAVTSVAAGITPGYNWDGASSQGDWQALDGTADGSTQVHSQSIAVWGSPHDTAQSFRQHPGDLSLHFFYGSMATHGSNDSAPLRRFRFATSGSTDWARDASVDGAVVAGASSGAQPSVGSTFADASGIWHCYVGGDVSGRVGGVRFDYIDAGGSYRTDHVPPFSPWGTAADQFGFAACGVASDSTVFALYARKGEPGVLTTTCTGRWDGKSWDTACRGTNVSATQWNWGLTSIQWSGGVVGFQQEYQSPSNTWVEGLSSPLVR